MLDIVVSPTISQNVWDSLGSTPTVPFDVEAFLDDSPAIDSDNRRSYHRLPMQGRAIMKSGGEVHGVYTVDVSPQGIGLYSPVQLSQQQTVELYFQQSGKVPLQVEQWRKTTLQVTRCHQEQASCYRCGARLLPRPMSPVEYRDFLRGMEL